MLLSQEASGSAADAASTNKFLLGLGTKALGALLRLGLLVSMSLSHLLHLRPPDPGAAAGGSR